MYLTVNVPNSRLMMLPMVLLHAVVKVYILGLGMVKMLGPFVMAWGPSPNCSCTVGLSYTWKRFCHECFMQAQKTLLPLWRNCLLVYLYISRNAYCHRQSPATLHNLLLHFCAWRLQLSPSFHQCSLQHSAFRSFLALHVFGASIHTTAKYWGLVYVTVMSSYSISVSLFLVVISLVYYLPGTYVVLIISLATMFMVNKESSYQNWLQFLGRAQQALSLPTKRSGEQNKPPAGPVLTAQHAAVAHFKMHHGGPEQPFRCKYWHFWALERFFRFCGLQNVVLGSGLLSPLVSLFWSLAESNQLHMSELLQTQFDVFNYPSAVKTAQSVNKLEYSDSNNPNTLWVLACSLLVVMTCWEIIVKIIKLLVVKKNVASESRWSTRS